MLFYNALLHHDRSSASPICWNSCVHSILPVAQHQLPRCVLLYQCSQRYAMRPLCVEEPAPHFPPFPQPPVRVVLSTICLQRVQTTAQGVSVKNAAREISTSSSSTTHKPSRPT